ncbi:MAG: phosphatase PAP2 family protein [Candidatus Woesearchaeota archaeon]
MLDSLMQWVSDWGIIVPLICVILMRDKRLVLRAAVALVIAFFLADVLKVVVARPRPGGSANGWFFSTPADVWGFPSKHASTSFALAVSVLLHRKVLGCVAAVFSVLVAVSRVYLNAHYWSDVIGGAVLGIVIAYATDRLAVYFEQSGQSGKR